MQVPPLSADEVRAVVQRELGVSDLSEVFDWIDLEEPLGSASLAQVRAGGLGGGGCKRGSIPDTGEGWCGGRGGP